MGIIYKATSPSGKVYIGKTFKTLVQRKNQHYSRAFRENRSKFDNAIRKYGDSLKWIILRDNIPENSLSKLEIEEIKKHDSFHSGYNGTEGGDGGKGHFVSEETRKKLSKASKGNKNMLGKYHSEKTKKIMSKIKKGKNNPNFGKRASKTTIKRMSKASKGKKHSEETKKKMSGEGNGRAKLNLKISQEIRTKYASGKYSYKGLAKEYNVGKTTVYRVINHLLWNK